ncbi:MAG: DUF6485 family protein [Candidatus Woesearchaeota archaeon]
MECKREINLQRCGCTYKKCSRKGTCCDCLAYHLKNRELPACCFPPEIESTYDRSFERFVEAVREGSI